MSPDGSTAGPLVVRPLVEGDLAALTAIYNDVIATSAAIYRDDPVTVEDRAAWAGALGAAGYPVDVATWDDEVVGFASFGPFDPFPGYRHTVEHSVHVRADQRGRGVGRALLARMVDAARDGGWHALVGRVDADNAASLALHERLGFERAGQLRQVGRKFDRWLDVVYLQIVFTER
jgi:L-amino acid N-acyltransferase YncA